ncbi:nucleotidyltransferase family protein [Anseongella ginsenosidimutans]|nr:nucleotidyltransferase family protein [Anseongella ginsenosidimutans]
MIKIVATGTAHRFYQETLKLLEEKGFPFLIGGAYALKEHTGVFRDTKDLDILCSAGECPRILKFLSGKGILTETTDARWLAKAFKNEHYIDFIFSSANNLSPVDDTWFAHKVPGSLYGVPVSFTAPEELIWSKIYVQNRERYDGADVNHLILKKGREMDWRRLMMHMEQHWQLLLAQLLNFQFVYPGERDNIPRWLFNELLKRAGEQYDLPAPVDKICRGPLLENNEYNADIIEWGYKIFSVTNL